MSQQNVEMVHRWWAGFNEDGFPPSISVMQIQMDVPGAAMWVIRDGKLVYAQGYLTMDEALEAGGLKE